MKRTHASTHTRTSDEDQTMQAKAKKAMIVDGKLDKYGRPNEKTPTDWKASYKPIEAESAKKKVKVEEEAGDGEKDEKKRKKKTEDSDSEAEKKPEKKKKKKADSDSDEV